MKVLLFANLILTFVCAILLLFRVVDDCFGWIWLNKKSTSSDKPVDIDECMKHVWIWELVDNLFYSIAWIMILGWVIWIFAMILSLF